MPREFSRSDRVASQLQREVADLLRSSFKDPDLGMVTVSHVAVSRDLAVAKVYVSFLGGALEAPARVRRLTERAPEFRHQIGQRMRLRVMPEIKFIHDDSIERGMQMDALLRSLQSASDDDGHEP